MLTVSFTNPNGEVVLVNPDYIQSVAEDGVNTFTRIVLRDSGGPGTNSVYVKESVQSVRELIRNNHIEAIQIEKEMKKSFAL